MSLSATDVSRIARLARLHMDESEIAAVQGQLNGIFGLIEAMQAVDTTGVAPMSHPQDVSLRLLKGLPPFTLERRGARGQ